MRLAPRLAVLLASWAALGPLAAPASAQVEARLNPTDAVGVGEVVVLEIEMETSRGSSSGNPDFKLDNLRVVGGPSQSTSLTIINGVQSSSVTLSWQLQPIQVGKARVHSIHCPWNGEDRKLKDLEIEVVEENQRPQYQDPLQAFLNRRRPSDQDDPFDSVFNPPRDRRPRGRGGSAPQVLLIAEAEPTNPYVGQQVTFTVYLLTQVSLNLQPFDDPPEFKGFWALDIPVADTGDVEMVVHDNEQYGRKVLLRKALFPRRAGRFQIDPIQAGMIAQVPDPRFGAFFPHNERIARTSNPVAIDVRELPPSPEGFQGAVGKLTLAATLEPRDLQVGEAATLTLTLSGKGHLQGISAPKIPEVPGVEVYAPQEESNEDVRGQTVFGERRWSYVLVPQRPGQWQVPAVEVAYFDPGRGRYDSAASEPFDLAVRGATSAAAPAGGDSVVELHPIRTAALPAVGGRRLGTAVLPWLFVAPWLLTAGLILLRSRGPSPGSRQARRRLLERLQTALTEERPRQAAADIEDAWRGFLETRWSIPPGTPSPQWGAILEERGVGSSAAAELVRLADDIHYLRYAPKLASIEGLSAELVERSRTLAKEVG